VRRTRTAVPAVLACVLLSVLVACDDPEPSADPPAGSRCHGIAYADVRGAADAAPPRRLLEHPVSDAVCEAWWVADLERGFVPQGLVVRRGRATIVGHDGSAPVGLKACRALVLDLGSGRVVHRTDRLDPPPGGPVATWCRHGGGAAASGAGLWVVETTRLWLLDPASLAVRRAWRLAEGVRGSTLVVAGGRLGIAGFDPEGPARIRWYDERSVLDDGVSLLGASRADPGLAPEEVERTPALLQGLADGGAKGLWQVSSRTTCGILTLPSGRVVDLVPGAEGIQVDELDVWVVSEASAGPYRSDDEPLVPALLRLDRAAVEGGGEPACRP
jgi:hypothetical protein